MTLKYSTSILSLSYQVGSSVAISDLARDEVDLEWASELLRRGVVSVAVAESSIEDDLQQCVGAALAEAKMNPEEIDAVIVVTESFAQIPVDATGSQFTSEFRKARDGLYNLLAGLGLDGAVILSATMAGCANLVQACAMARCLIGDGLYRSILLIAFDRCPDVASRYMTEAISIAGDGAAACLMARQEPGRPGRISLDYVNCGSYGRMESESDMGTQMLHMFRSMRSTVADCYDTCSMQPGDFKWAILGEYNPATSRTYGKLIGFEEERVYSENVGRRGHITFDPLIGLADLLNQNKLNAGDNVLLFICGPVSCGAIACCAV